jgi:hypothetical protein
VQCLIGYSNKREEDQLYAYQDLVIVLSDDIVKCRCMVHVSLSGGSSKLKKKLHYCPGLLYGKRHGQQGSHYSSSSIACAWLNKPAKSALDIPAIDTGNTHLTGSRTSAPYSETSKSMISRLPFRMAR